MAASFSSRSAANEAVARYQRCDSAEARREAADQLYRRHLPLIWKTLATLCGRSRCYPGGCLVEDLVGEAYLIFCQALEQYEPSVGLDFLGYLRWKLHWGLEHRVRVARKASVMTRAPEEEAVPGRNGEEERLLDRVLASQLLSRLEGKDIELAVLHYACGRTSREVAEAYGISGVAVRKRLERLRGRLRALALHNGRLSGNGAEKPCAGKADEP
ncbi:MAG: sigma-70 family RNA polymerase sigma factor [Gemmatimonadetes bacterium]|nr:sigma-70 family RNA polymerase sigma factor [Gemmatimonadota bacterium]